MSVQSRYQQRDLKHEEQYHQEQRQQSSGDGFVNYSSTSIWLSGLKYRPTLFLPDGLAKKFNMHSPCKIAIIDNGNGILLKYLHPNIRTRQQQKQQEREQNR